MQVQEAKWRACALSQTGSQDHQELSITVIDL